MERGYLPIGEAAKRASMTSEALRHYDRIGLVRPGRVDERTGYRYYSAEDIVRLNTVGALQQMGLPLREIKRVLEYDDLEAIVAFLEQAERRADEKIALLQEGKAKIRRARADYEGKIRGRQAGEGRVVARRLPERVVMLADAVETVTADDLWSYQRHFYERLSPEQRELFAFEDVAGVYREGSSARYCAVCTRHGELEGLKTLPAGTYLCVECAEEDRHDALARLLEAAWDTYQVRPEFSLQLVVVSGILQWTYELQVYVGA